MLEFRLLGTLEASDGAAIALGSRKQRALLAYLLLHRNEASRRDAVIDALWADDPPASAGHAIDVYASRLRAALSADGLLEARGGSLRLNVPDDAVDSARFERLLAAARAADSPVDRLTALDQALGLWRGSPLADLRDEPFVRLERERLEEERRVALEDRFDALLALGRHDEIVSSLQTFVSEHPLRERPRRLLMLALYRAGRQTDALEVYRSFGRLLRDDLGLDPSPQLRELEAAVLRHDPALAAPPAGPAAAEAQSTLWRRRRRALLVLAGSAAVLSGSLLAVLALTGGAARALTVTIPHASAAPIDPQSGRVGPVVPLRGQPIAALAVGDAVWVASSTERTLTRIDDRSGAVATVGLPAEPVALAYGAGRLWVASLDEKHALTAVDPRSGDVVFSIPLSQPGLQRFGAADIGASGVAFGAGSVWVIVGVSGLVRLSPSGEVIHRFVVGPTPNAVTAGASAIWVALIGPAQIREIDPSSNTLGRPIDVGNMAWGSETRASLHCAIAVAGTSIWAPAYSDGAVWRVSALAGFVRGVVQTGGSPCTVAVGLGEIWIGNPNTQEIDAIDPVGGALVRRIEISSPPNSIAVTSRHLWVVTS